MCCILLKIFLGFRCCIPYVSFQDIIKRFSIIHINTTMLRINATFFYTLSQTINGLSWKWAPFLWKSSFKPAKQFVFFSYLASSNAKWIKGIQRSTKIVIFGKRHLVNLLFREKVIKRSKECNIAILIAFYLFHSKLCFVDIWHFTFRFS